MAQIGAGVDRDLNEHRLTMLMDYTKFHIGLYATLITILLAVASLGSPSHVAPELRQWLYLPIVLVLLAGICGGIIAGNLPEQTSFKRFWQGRTGPWGRKCIPTRYVARAEHFFFWAAVVSGILVTVCVGSPPKAELQAETKTHESARTPTPAPAILPRGEAERSTVPPGPAPVGSAPAPSDLD